MDFGFIGLPRECLLDPEEEEVEELLDWKVTRTMSCVGDSICFVCIDPSMEHVCIDPSMEHADDLVKTWTLKLPRGNSQKPRWEKMEEVRVSELWGLDGFEEARLPKAPLKYPVLTADGALCVMLADQSKLPRHYRALNLALVGDDICIFDMSRKRFQYLGFAHNYYFTDHLLIPSGFLQSKA